MSASILLIHDAAGLGSCRRVFRPPKHAMDIYWLIAECYSTSFLHFHGADGAGSMVDHGWYETCSGYPARLLDSQKTPQQVRGGCNLFSAYFRPPFRPAFGLGFQALKMEVCKSRPQAFESRSTLILHIACGLLNLLAHNFFVPLPIPSAAPSSAPLGASILPIRDVAGMGGYQ